MKTIEQDIAYNASVQAMNRVMVSIFTVVRHSVDISATIHAVLSQTLQRFEWSIIVTGSSGSTSYLDDISQSDPRIRVIQGHGGKAGSLNQLILQGNSDYIFFIDAGDVPEDTALEKMLLTLCTNSEFDFVSPYRRDRQGKGHTVRNVFPAPGNLLDQDPGTNFFVTGAGVFRSLLFDESLHDDLVYWDFWLNAATFGYTGYTIPEVLYTSDGAAATGTLYGDRDHKALLNLKYAAKLAEQRPAKKLSVFNFDKQVGDLGLSTLVTGSSQQQSVLFLLPYLEVGGADKFNLDLVSGLRQKNWAITIACTLKSENTWASHFLQETDDVFFLDHYANDSLYFRIIDHLIASRKPSAVFISHAMYGYYIVPYIRKKFPGIRILDYLHCEAPGWHNGGYPFISTLYHGLLDKTITSSQHLKNWCIGRGATESKTEVCYINIDFAQTCRNENKRRQIRKDLRIPDEKPVLLFVGRLTEQKQPLVLLKSLEKLYRKNKNFHCLVIGDGPDRKKLLHATRKSVARNSIHYLGQLDNERVKDYMDAADIFFLPSAFEGIALTIYEAMAKSLAIVSANVGGQRELVTADCGFLVERSDSETESEEYAGILNKMLESPSLVSEMQRNSRHRVVSNFGLNKMIDKIESIIKQSISNVSAAETDIAPHYLLLLNRLVFQTHVTDVLWTHSNNRFNSFLKRYRKPYNIGRRIYHKLKASFSS